MTPDDIIVFSPRRRFATQNQRRLAAQSRYDLAELECSDYGRDPRFLAGWWIIPLSFLSVLSVWLCVVA